jgi:hypothetical protein
VNEEAMTHWVLLRQKKERNSLHLAVQKKEKVLTYNRKM